MKYVTSTDVKADKSSDTTPPAVVHNLGTHAHALSVVYVLFTDLFINALQFVLIYSSPYNKLKTCFYLKLDLYFYKPCLFLKFSFNVSYFII